MGSLSTQIVLGGACAGAPSSIAGVRLRTIVTAPWVCCSLQRSFNVASKLAFSGRNRCRTAFVLGSDSGEGERTSEELLFHGSGNDVRENEKVSGIHWWYKTASHAAELTGGFYNPCNRDGYAPIAAMLKKHDAALNFTCVELRTLDQNEEFPEALADPEGLVWQVLNAAWDVSIPVASENALPCYDRDGYNKILENAKPLNDPDTRHLSAFTYLRLSPDLMERQNLLEFEHFVKRMHGEAVS